MRAHDERRDVFGAERERLLGRLQSRVRVLGLHEVALGEFDPGADVFRILGEPLPHQGLGLVTPVDGEERVGALHRGMQSGHSFRFFFR
ncbi:hypothetical protein ACFZAE_23700 [Streptomyces scabiei]|uniref:hypothetical protein n=1 Tax=Streptomyces scabiei TaxID=1930 RepID=UPI0036EB80C7